MQQDIKLNQMISEILNEGKDAKNEILNKTNEWINSEIEKTKKEVSDETAGLIKQRSEQIIINSGRTVTGASIEARRSLFKRRREIMEITFNEAKKQIEEFTKTETYKTFLLKSAENIAAALPNGCTKISMRETDKPFAEEIVKRFGNSITIQTDNNIKLGGIIAFSADGDTMIDDTLDERLEKQKEWFVNNSGLTLL